MIERTNLRINLIFTAWFLAVAVIPSVLVAYFSFVLERNQVEAAAHRQLAVASRLKADRLSGHVIDTMVRLRDIGHRFALQQGGTTGLFSLLDLLEEDNAAPLYFVENGSVVYPEAAPDGMDLAWLGDLPPGEPHARLVSGALVIAYPWSAEKQWLVSVQSRDRVDALLYSDINDTRFLSRSHLAGAPDDIGRTGDVIVFDSDASALSRSLMIENVSDASSLSPALAAWIRGSRDSVLSVRTILRDGREVLLHARRVMLLDHEVTQVLTQDTAETMSGLYENLRGAFLTYIFILIFVLIFLYIFVRNVSSIVVKPIQRTIQELETSSRKFQQSIGATLDVMKRQEQVSESLSKSSKAQHADIKGLDAGLETIVSSLTGIGRQTKKAATNVKEIDALANESQKQAEDARTTLTSIKKLATAHEALLQTLQQYSEQVDRVASDVRKLARAIKYLSLNATIEANKDGRDAHSLSALVSEVGRLSVMGRDASIHINSLVRTIQDQLSQSKASALQEREEAQLSLRVLDKALSSLQEMSDDAITIAKSVTIIDDQIRKQTESTQSIASHSKDLTGQAKATLREAGKVTDLVGELKNSARANSTAVNKLLGIIAKLGSMIGSRR